MKFRNIVELGLLLICCIVLGFVSPTLLQEKKAISSPDTVYTYQKNILPLLQANCNPCHFPGGKVYKKLPFDDSKTVVAHAKRLNTRLKQKEQQAIINGWVESGAKEK